MPQFCPTSSQLERLALASPFAYQLYTANPVRFNDFLSQFPLDIVLPDIAHIVHARTNSCVCEQALMAALRQLRQCLMVRWIWQDALGLIAVMRLTYELSAFADSCLVVAQAFMYDKLVARVGAPFFRQGATLVADEFAIIAMGKLGAGELNLSSDIDLVFVHRADGRTVPTKTGKSWDNHKFMLAMGRGIIKLLHEVSADGFVFRIDMRLRPWGEGSALVITLGALTQYLTKHGRTWERFAWLKARVVNDVSADFLSALQSTRKNFVFRYYVDYSAFSALREMRTLIINQVAQREARDNIKLGVGGIRDIEFIAQSFALIYGGKYPQLTEVQACLPALQLLNTLQLLDKPTTDNLVQAYCFLRRVEHAIQAQHDTQSQRLPSGEMLEALAQTLGFVDSQDFLLALEAHRHAVSVPFDKLVMQREYTSVGAPRLTTEIEMRALEAHLPKAQLALLQDFLHSKLVTELSQEARARLHQAYPVILHALQRFAGQITVNKETVLTTTITRLLALLEMISKRSIYLVMLSENPNATLGLIPMLAASSWVADELKNYPVLLDTFLQQNYCHLPDKSELGAILHQALLSVTPDDDEAFLMSIRLFKKTQVLAVAVSDVLEAKPIMQVSDSLTFIAEVVLQACLRRAYEALIVKHGYPLAVNGERLNADHCGVAIIGYGKLGGIELGYNSDLDLVFLHRLAQNGYSDGEVPISGLKFATRLVQKLMNYLTAQTRDGRVYELDTRLRPSGNAGVMVVSLAAFLHYQNDQAWVWEHQALVRARGICGDSEALSSFEQIRAQVLTSGQDERQLQTQICDMREKMRAHLANNDSNQFHLKQDVGGLVDIEFIAQYAVLRYANLYPALSQWSDNIRIFERLEELGIWDNVTCQTLKTAYLRLRKAVHKQALAEQSVLVLATDWVELRADVDAIWQRIFIQGEN